MPKGKKPLEKELYQPMREYLEIGFNKSSGHCHLEITADGNFSEKLKSVVRHNIVFSFLGKKASPDLAGFTVKDPIRWATELFLSVGSADIQDFITVEIKREKITPQDIYQAKMYGDLFYAKFALLISPEPIPEEIKRLHKELYVLGRFMSGWQVYIGQWFNSPPSISWFPNNPF